MTDRVVNIHQSINYPRPESLHTDTLATLRKLAGFTATPPQWIADTYWRQAIAPAPRKGDKVEVVLTGYVDRVDVNGNVHLVDRRTPFKDEAKFVGVGPAKDGDGFTVRVVERAPAAPKVGDTIGGATVRATPWKRGTMLRGATYGDSDRRYVLTAAGTWHSINSGIEHPFADVLDDERYVVEHAPGK